MLIPSFHGVLLLDREAEGHGSSHLVRDLESIGSRSYLLMYFKYDRAFPGCRVHGPFYDLAFLGTQVYLSFLGAEPQTFYRGLSPWGAGAIGCRGIDLRFLEGKGSGEVDGRSAFRLLRLD